MSPPGTPAMTIVGPILATAFTAEGERRWNVIATFGNEAEAQGFAVWCQSDHPALAASRTPTVIWRETTTGADSDRLPAEDRIIMESVASYFDRDTGQGRVVISYRSAW